MKQGRYPLVLPQRAPLAPTAPVFAATPAHHFTDSQQNGRPSKEDTHDEFTDRLSWKGNTTYSCLVTAPFWRSYASVAMPLPKATWRHGRRPCWRCILHPGPVCRTSCLLYALATVCLDIVKRPPLGSPQSGHHSIGDRQLQQKYG